MKTFKQFINESSIEDIENHAKENNVELGIHHNTKTNNITLSKIVVPKQHREKGIGSSVMNKLKGFADNNKSRITLTPSTDFGGSSVNRLKKFYKKHGFVENKGKNKDYSVSDSMYRNPE
jgi:predicted GNAT family N-acyltransferase